MDRPTPMQRGANKLHGTAHPQTVAAPREQQPVSPTHANALGELHMTSQQAGMQPVHCGAQLLAASKRIKAKSASGRACTSCRRYPKRSARSSVKGSALSARPPLASVGLLHLDLPRLVFLQAFSMCLLETLHLLLGFPSTIQSRL